MERFDTLEGVSVAIDGVKNHLALMTKGFFWTAGGGALAIAYLFATTTYTSIAIGKIETRLDGHDKHFAAIESRLDGHDKHFEAIENRLDKIEDRLDTITAKLDKLEVPLLQKQGLLQTSN